MADGYSIEEALKRLLESAFKEAEVAVNRDKVSTIEIELSSAADAISSVARTSHNGRGIVLTLAAYKVLVPEQDIRSHKSEHPGGFNARSLDTNTVCSFLRSKGLAAAAESHWLTQIFSGAEPFRADRPLRTNPRAIGQLVPQVVCELQDDPAKCRAAVRLILAHLIVERNKGTVALTRPKNLTVQQAIDLLSKHFATRYKHGAPRLPQLAIYAIYRCLVAQTQRFKGLTLEPLERMKTANRKSGSVGDVDLSKNGRPFEAVEVKLGIQIGLAHIEATIDKIKAQSVERYYVLSTAGVAETDLESIRQACESFRRTNGCEIIVNGVLETVGYYLRLLESTTDFLANYVDLLGMDADVDYEHREAWNKLFSTD